MKKHCPPSFFYIAIIPTTPISTANLFKRVQSIPLLRSLLQERSYIAVILGCNEIINFSHTFSKPGQYQHQNINIKYTGYCIVLRTENVHFVHTIRNTRTKFKTTKLLHIGHEFQVCSLVYWNQRVYKPVRQCLFMSCVQL